MIAEDNFIKKLEVFLESGLSDFEKEKVRIILKEYREEIPAIIINRKVFVPRIPPSKICSNDDLMREAKELCKENNISLKDFLTPAKGKSTARVTDTRKMFVNKIFSNYKTDRKQLYTFLNIDRSTLSYYIIGKKFKYIRKSERKETA